MADHGRFKFGLKIRLETNQIDCSKMATSLAETSLSQ